MPMAGILAWQVAPERPARNITWAGAAFQPMRNCQPWRASTPDPQSQKLWNGQIPKPTSNPPHIPFSTGWGFHDGQEASSPAAPACFLLGFACLSLTFDGRRQRAKTTCTCVRSLCFGAPSEQKEAKGRYSKIFVSPKRKKKKNTKKNIKTQCIETYFKRDPSCKVTKGRPYPPQVWNALGWP